MNTKPPVVHIWTIDQIKALPQFGSQMGWFFGLVQDDYTGDDGNQIDLVVLAEIYPGMGYAAVTQDDSPEWATVLRDLKRYPSATTGEVVTP